jgi:hypothetical protein
MRTCSPESVAIFVSDVVMGAFWLIVLSSLREQAKQKKSEPTREIAKADL